MYWSGCQSTGAEMRKYFTVETACKLNGWEPGDAQRALLTVVYLLQRHLSIMR